VSSVRSALQARRRQYQIRQHLTDTLQVTRELQAAHLQKDEFLAMLAHELRNPLAPIRNAIEILRDPESAAGTPPELLDMMERQVSHLVRLVDDLLDVSRILRGKITLRKENIELASVISRAVETARPLIDAGSHELTIDLPPDPIHLHGDVVRLSQIFANLLNNAAKYTEPHGHIRVTAERVGNEAIVRVRDDGMGISPQLLPRVFDLFSQAERSLDRSQGGLGLGLTLVRRLVEMHGGRIEAKSEGPGRGSEFGVRLPIHATNENQPKAPVVNSAVVSRVPGPSRRILVIDDNVDAAESLATLLRRAGHHVETAYDGRSALAEVEVLRPEAVLLDIGLPGMNGYEVARHLRKGPATNGVILVAVTGYGQAEDRRLALEAGFDHHLVKPIDPDVVSSLIDTIQAGQRPGLRARAPGSTGPA
jgi:CheY-like chemotaxis protein/nitrogen-specific signal transduction histidine kinase